MVFWVVEAVATDGPITERRRERLLGLGREEQNLRSSKCRFLSVFVSRADATVRRRQNLARGTFAWYADEPEHELAWYELE